MKSFEELFNEASIVADNRSKFLNALIDKTKSELLPRFCEICDNLDIKTVYFRTEKKVFANSEKRSDECGEYYVLALHINDGTITDAEFNYIGNKYRVPEYWKGTKIEEAKLLRTGIIEFVTILKDKLERQIESNTAEAENALLLL